MKMRTALRDLNGFGPFKGIRSALRKRAANEANFVFSMFMFLRLEIGKYFRETTIHGLVYIATQRNWLAKIFWSLVVIGGFSFAYLLCKQTLSDWEENPFMTTVETRPITEVQFPTVTICSDPYKVPDKWALIKMLANHVKFECYDINEGYPDCSETQTARNHPAFKRILDLAVENMVANIDAVPLDMSFPATVNPLIVEPLSNVTVADAVERGKEMLGQAIWHEDLFGECRPEEERNCSMFCDPVVMNESKAECALRVAKVLRVIDVLHPETRFMPFGTFLAAFSELLEMTFGGPTDIVYCPWVEAEETALHGYFRSLSMELGLGNVSLYDIPVIFSPKTLEEFDYEDFVDTYCMRKQEDRNTLSRLLREWNTYISKDPIGVNREEYPCSNYNESECRLLSNLVMPTANKGTTPSSLFKLIRIMKVASHIGMWSNNHTMVETPEFPVYRRKDLRAMANAKKFGRKMSLLVTDSKHKVYDAQFQPVVTDMSMCLATNTRPMSQIFKENLEFRDTYEKAFSEDIILTSTVENNIGSGEYYSLEFQADLQLPFSEYLDKTKNINEFFYIALNWHHNMFAISQRKIRIRPGFKTFIKVSIQGSNITEDVINMDVGDRKCKMTHENENMKLFKTYTKKGCLFECQLKKAAEVCQCIPWNYPNPVGGISATCDTYGASCFEYAMQGQSTTDDCSCPPDCQELTFSYSVQEIPIDVERVCVAPSDAFMYKRAQLYPGFIYNYMSLVKNVRIDGEPQSKNVRSMDVKLCKAVASRGIAQVSIMLDNDVYTMVTKSRKSSFSGIVGTIGGTLGLFTGMSIISMVEIVYWIVKSLVSWCRAEQEKKRNSAKTQVI